MKATARALPIFQCASHTAGNASIADRHTWARSELVRECRRGVRAVARLPSQQAMRTCRHQPKFVQALCPSDTDKLVGEGNTSARIAPGIGAALQSPYLHAVFAQPVQCALDQNNNSVGGEDLGRCRFFKQLPAAKVTIPTPHLSAGRPLPRTSILFTFPALPVAASDYSSLAVLCIAGRASGRRAGIVSIQGFSCRPPPARLLSVDKTATCGSNAKQRRSG